MLLLVPARLLPCVLLGKKLKNLRYGGEGHVLALALVRDGREEVGRSLEAARGFPSPFSPSPCDRHTTFLPFLNLRPYFPNLSQCLQYLLEYA